MRLFPHLSTEKVNRRIAMSFVLAIVLISLGFALSLYSYSQSQKASQRFSHTIQVINALEDILSLAKDIETATRGYMLARQEIFLEPYKNARPKIYSQLEKLRHLVADSPLQLAATDTLKRLVEAKIDISDRQIDQNTQSTSQTQRAYLEVGKVRMDQLREYAAKMITREQKYMRQRDDDAIRSFRNTLLLILALSLVTFAVLIIAYSLLERELKHRAENEIQLRQYEAELHDKIQQLEVSNQELERFAFVASHDMQEPLRKIQAFGNLLVQHYPPQGGSDGPVYLNKVLTSADRMSKLIRDLLSFSRLKNQPDAFERISLGEVLDRALVDLELPIKTSNATITVGTMPTLDAVPSQLEQLLVNLISNALKYTKPGVPPMIGISAERVPGTAYPGLSANQWYYALSIADSGIGFDEKYVDRIFDVFQRLHAKAEYEGTGIGLAICKRVVAYHNGYITARSRIGIGTTFVIVLPENQVTVPTHFPNYLQPNQQHEEAL